MGGTLESYGVKSKGLFMRCDPTPLSGLFVLTPNVWTDDRGYFMETFHVDILRQLTGHAVAFIQDNQSLSLKKGTLRGIHFQKNPFAQAKLVRCISGEIWDLAVDLRPESPTFGQFFGVTLSAENAKQLLIPRGFGHAFVTLSDNCVVAYKVDNVYNKDAECTLRFDDPILNITWPTEITTVSEKDKNGIFFRDYTPE
jgi:dTDP-4-dehydrorhamnose 3,5-epimerase